MFVGGAWVGCEEGRVLAVVGGGGTYGHAPVGSSVDGGVGSDAAGVAFG